MSLSTSPLCTCEATSSQSRSRSSKFLKGLVHRPRVKSLSPTRPENVGSALDAFHKLGQNGQACAVCAKCSPRPQSWDVSTPWKRQGQTPGMDDYLTLAQLEECLDRQAFYIGCIEIPQQITNHTYSRSVEAPSIKDHSTHFRPAQPCQLQPEPRTHLAHQSNPTVIDGVTHPALRESALQPIPSIIVDQGSPLTEPQHESSRLVVPVPSTNWTYGR